VEGTSQANIANEVSELAIKRLGPDVKVSYKVGTCNQGKPGSYHKCTEWTATSISIDTNVWIQLSVHSYKALIISLRSDIIKQNSSIGLAHRFLKKVDNLNLMRSRLELFAF